MSNRIVEQFARDVARELHDVTGLDWSDPIDLGGSWMIAGPGDEAVVLRQDGNRLQLVGRYPVGHTRVHHLAPTRWEDNRVTVSADRYGVQRIIVRDWVRKIRPVYLDRLAIVRKALDYANDYDRRTATTEAALRATLDGSLYLPDAMGTVEAMGDSVRFGRLSSVPLDKALRIIAILTEED
jgi:hypothetical protein